MYNEKRKMYNDNDDIINSPTPPKTSFIRSSADRMSMFFFRLHNLQREQENKRKKTVAQQRQRQRRGAKVFRSDSDTTGHLTLAPSRLFEKTPVNPSDSLDEIALQIPRYFWSIDLHIFSLHWQNKGRYAESLIDFCSKVRGSCDKVNSPIFVLI